jgi:hypothetical protein
MPPPELAASSFFILSAFVSFCLLLALSGHHRRATGECPLNLGIYGYFMLVTERLTYVENIPL